MTSTRSDDDALWIRGTTPVLVLFARQRCHCAEDVVQEAMLKWFQQDPRPENPRAWLFRVVRRLSANAQRADRRRERHESVASGRNNAWFMPTPDVALDVQAVTDSLGQQTLEDREIIVARLWGGLSFDEIATLTETSPSTASRRYQSAIASLRRDLNVNSLRKDSSRGQT